jgi:hypothetical protein
MSQVRPKEERVGKIAAAKAVVQLFFATGKSFTVDRVLATSDRKPPLLHRASSDDATIILP